MIHVLCFGNELHGDDGFGIHVGRALANRAAPDRARVFEVGTRGIDALALTEGCSRVVLVDALRDSSDRPGTLRRLDARELEPDCATLSHDAPVAWLVRAMHSATPFPPAITLIGAVSGGIRTFEPGLSAPVAACVPEATRRVLELIASDDGNG